MPHQTTGDCVQADFYLFIGNWYLLFVCKTVPHYFQAEMASGVHGALGAAAVRIAGAAPRRGTDSAKAGNRGAKGAGVTG